MNRFLTILLCLSFGFTSNGQSSYIYKDETVNRAIDRMDIKYNSDYTFHSSLKNYSKQEINDFVKQLDKSELSEKDKYRIRKMYYLVGSEMDIKEQSSLMPIEKKYVDSANVFYTFENRKYSQQASIENKAFLKYFYKTPGQFYEIENDYLKMSVNPILNIRYGKDTESDDLLFQNTRGIRLEGVIDDKVYFYTDLLENQGSFLQHIENRIQKHKAIPGHGSYKPFQSSVVDNVNGYDFPLSTAYVGFNISKSIAIELGHGKHFIGDGYNSLIMDDYGNNYFYLKFRTKIWKLLYQNIFSELAPISQAENPGDFLLDKKYMASHYLSFKPTKNTEVGLFETVLFTRENNFELQYLNPVILYRTVEFNLDSPDNVIIGLNAKWNVLNRFSFYGQLVLDEFLLSEITSGSGWWANKYGFQLGAKYIDVLGIDQLDAQVEYNYVRPYTFTHRDTLEGFNTSIANYSHFNQPMAHPLGANFKELILGLNYKPFDKFYVNARIMLAIYGEDNGQNWGGNILLPLDSRVMDFGNVLGQGIETNIFQLRLDASYELYDNVYVDLEFLYRNKESEVESLNVLSNYIGAGIRANLNRQKLDY